MIDFNPLLYRYASRRNVVYGRKGMVCTGQPLAAQAGLDILKQGGNAVDAAIAAAAALTMVEPTGNGLGSDAFALVWIKNKLYGLNGSGYAPAALTTEAMQTQKNASMPKLGWASVDVPGAVSAWAELHKRFGKLPFGRLFAPAISYAEEGFVVTPQVGKLWQNAEKVFAEKQGDPAFAGLFNIFFPQSKAPAIGTVVKIPQAVRTLQLIAESYGEEFYQGEIAKEIVAFAQQTGGYLSAADLAGYKAEWVEPVSVKYRGYDVWELPPNGHGLVALLALNILNGMEVSPRDTVDNFHKQIEAMKLAFADGLKYIADERYMKTTVEQLLAPAYAAKRRKLIGEAAAEPAAGDPQSGGTVYLCTADEEGNMVSFIQSNFIGFGSGIVVPSCAVALNSRASAFSLEPSAVNCLAPGKKPYHTIIPGFLTKDGQAVGPFGVMGAFMQPQGHVQVITNTIDYLMNPQEALDAPRWQWIKGKEIQLEAGVDKEVMAGLKARGHKVQVVTDLSNFGRGEIIWRGKDGVLCGATEGRTDGCVAVW